ncbi:MAG: TlpA family protein disulfide reductase [Tenacibaculum sp.]
MKKITLMLVIAIAALSCKQEETPVDYAIITGKIENADFEELAVSKAFRKYSHMVKVNEDGTFTDTIRTNPGRYTFYEVKGENSTEFYFDKGDQIHISYDANDHKNTLTFTGKGSEASAYMIKSKDKLKQLREAKKGYALIDSSYTIEAAKKQIEKTTNKRLEELNAEKGLSKDFIAQETRKIKAKGVATLMDQHLVLGGVEKMMTTLEFPDAFLKEMKTEIDWNNHQDSEDLIPIMRMQGFYNAANGFKIAADKNISRTRGIIEFIKTNYTNKKVKGDLLLQNFMALMTEEDDITAIFNDFKALDVPEESKAEFKKVYDEALPISKGQLSPKFENYENYAGGTTSLDDFKGNYVYIDLWATWCNPCKKEIPDLKKLEKEYHGKNIEFVSISCDVQKQKALWQKTVKDLDLTGVQLITDNDFNTPFVRAYKANTIPRFILIDPEGKIVKNNAPKPSDSERIRALFNSLDLKDKK